VRREQHARSRRVVTGGVLNLTVGMANYTTSVKQFAAPLLQKRTVDLS
jgi:hypothetical protein